jgi:hypothetical protein
MKKILLTTAVLAVCLAACSPAKKPASGAAIPEPAAVSLAKDLMPVFAESCTVCHRRENGSEAAIEGGTIIETKEDILKAVGTGIVPGKPEASPFLKVLDQTIAVGRNKLVMPPPNAKAPKWTAEELALFSRWIAEGAKDN